MADAVGIEGLHSITGNCDLCGQLVDPGSEELNILGCTFSDCSGQAYHQDCLEKYLKSIRLERNRKTGFKCPRGCGKGTAYKEACPGRIDKSHPIHPRNEESKKRRKAKLPEPAAPKPPPCKKEKGKSAESKEDDTKPKAVDKIKEKTKLSPFGAIAVFPKAVSLKKVEIPSKEKLAELRDQALREIGMITNKEASRDKIADPLSLVRPVSANTKQPLTSVWGRAASSSHLSTSNGSVGSPLISSHQLPVDSDTISHSMPIPSALRQPSKPVLQVQQVSQQMSHCIQTSGQQGPAAGHSHPTVSFQHQPNAQPPTPHSYSSSLPPPSPQSVLPVGMDYAESEEQPKLTKAQKKNLKRAERKKKQLASETASLQSSEQESLAQAEHDTILFDMFIQALVSHKVLCSLQQLQQLGFPKWACVAAVKRHGCQLEDAVSWLLEEEFDDPDSVLHSVANACPAIEVEEELQQLHDLQMITGLSAAVVQEAVVENNGDVHKTLAALVDSTDIASMNGSQPTLSHAASCVSVHNGLFAYSLSNDSGDDGSELHGHFTQESNSLLDVLLEPSEPSLTPTAGCVQPNDLLAQQSHYSNGSSSIFHDSQLAWPAAPGVLASSQTVISASTLAGARNGASSERVSDNCWHPLMGPSLLGLESRPGQLNPAGEASGLGMNGHMHGSNGLLSDLLPPPNTSSGQVPRVSLFQHASEYDCVKDLATGQYDIWSGSAHSQQHLQDADHQSLLRQGGLLGFDLKTDSYELVDKNGWMGGMLGDFNPSNIPSAALRAAAAVPGDDHIGVVCDENDLSISSLMACLRCPMA